MTKSKAELTLKSVHTLYYLSQAPEVELSGGGNQENQANEHMYHCPLDL